MPFDARRQTFSSMRETAAPVSISKAIGSSHNFPSTNTAEHKSKLPTTTWYCFESEFAAGVVSGTPACTRFFFFVLTTLCLNMSQFIALIAVYFWFTLTLLHCLNGTCNSVTDSCSDHFASAVSVPTFVTGMWKEEVGVTGSNNQGANISQLERDIGSDQFPPNEHYFGLVNVSTVYSLPYLYFVSAEESRTMTGLWLEPSHCFVSAEESRTMTGLWLEPSHCFVSAEESRTMSGLWLELSHCFVSAEESRTMTGLWLELMSAEESRTMIGLWLELSHCFVSAEESRTMTGLWLELSHCFVSAEESRTMIGLWLELSRCFVSSEESRTMTGLWLELKEFDNYMQQDAHEFLNFLINHINEIILAERHQNTCKPKSSNGDSPVPQPEPTWVHEIFQGILTSETRCLNCETVSSKDEDFFDLQVDVDQNTSITHCLKCFSNTETLCSDNKFKCDHCCSYQEAQKRMRVKKLPMILALHLKRFKYMEQYNRHIKVSHRVVFPLELRLFNTSDDAVNPDRMYDLVAVVIHCGSGPNRGHYISIVKSHGFWLLFDDDMVDKIDASTIEDFYGLTSDIQKSSETGYILFYQSRDCM
uniref:ubiquitinyl hydrolase 1 n=1 Tax=Timema californicum TaxID=61474 RepID=A0A7R9JC66_TIMCA|nr:unnamed protein product [Timema californicum]